MKIFIDTGNLEEIDAGLGADICTCPASLIDQLFEQPLTDIGLGTFLKDWDKAQAVQV